MAKKKDELEDLLPPSPEDILKIITKKYGDIAFDGSHIAAKRRDVIPITPTLDIANHGGIKEGSWNLISGKKKTGKTTLALQIAANAQMLGKHVYYLNVEHRFDDKNLSTVRHLRTTPDCWTIFQSTQGNILSAQKFLNLFSDLSSESKNCVIIIDSISSLCSENELSKDIGEASRPEGPKLFGQTCRKLASTVPINNITVIGILHLIANTSGYGAPFMEDGGNKIQYQCDNKFMCKNMSFWEKTNGKIIGQVVDWEVAISGNGAPGGKAKTYLRYGFGYDNVWEIVNMAIDLNLIQKGGAWFTFINKDGESVKVQGQEKVYDYFVENQEECIKMHNLIKEMIE